LLIISVNYLIVNYRVADYIKPILSENEKKLDSEQRELLDLLNYTVDTGRKDFAEKHNFYGSAQ